MIFNSKLRGAQNTKHEWEGPSSGKWGVLSLNTVSGGTGKEQQIDHFEVGHEVRDICVIINYKPNYCTKLQTHTCAGLILLQSFLYLQFP